MAVTSKDVFDAETAFLKEPEPLTAAMYLSKLREAEEVGAIDDHRFHQGLQLVEHYLWKGGSVVHD